MAVAVVSCIHADSQAGPASTQPANTQPATIQPATQPAATQGASTQPTRTQLATSQPAIIKPTGPDLEAIVIDPQLLADDLEIYQRHLRRFEQRRLGDNGSPDTTSVAELERKIQASAQRAERLTARILENDQAEAVAELRLQTVKKAIDANAPMTAAETDAYRRSAFASDVRRRIKHLKAERRQLAEQGFAKDHPFVIDNTELLQRLTTTDGLPTPTTIRQWRRELIAALEAELLRHAEARRKLQDRLGETLHQRVGLAQKLRRMTHRELEVQTLRYQIKRLEQLADSAAATQPAGSD